MKNIIFLDIDGVLNYAQWYTSPRNPNQGFIQTGDFDLDPFCIERINILAELTDSAIVISSDWRTSSNCFQRLRNAGLAASILDSTPIRINSIRGEEIDIWRYNNPNYKNYVIIDDKTDFYFYKYQVQHLVVTDPYLGFTDNNLLTAINILKE